MANSFTLAGADGKLATVDRVLQILTAVAQQGSPVPVKQLGELTGLPSSTLYRHLAVLRRWGFVEEAEREGTYEPGPMSLQLAWGGQASQLVKTTHAELEALVAQTGESAGLMVAVNGHVVCLDMVESPQSLRCSFCKGSAIPMLNGASAKAQLAFLPARERAEIIRQHVGPEPSDARAALEHELQTIRDQGYAVSEGEVDWGVWGVSVPILSRSDRLLGGLSLMAPSIRVADRHRQLIQSTVAAAGRIGRTF
ncbi:IclR family transcriptional regulator [Denitromonas sp.]|uniref:IclR family transcriptional regulator n=1 Tax=Denitromonas sp. TaxID=2734609 RepID=UPI003A836859